MSQILHADADGLILRKVPVLISRGFKEAVSKLNFNDDDSLLHTEELSEVFSEPPIPRHLHIAVRVPPAGECEWLST
jgi:hypothetical protein